MTESHLKEREYENMKVAKDIELILDKNFVLGSPSEVVALEIMKYIVEREHKYRDALKAIRNCDNYDCRDYVCDKCGKRFDYAIKSLSEIMADSGVVEEE